MKLVVITPSKLEDNEISAVNQMFEAGLETLHLRKSRLSTKELEEYIKQIPTHFHNRIIIHSHHKLAIKYNLKGIHFTDSHLNKKFRLWWNNKMIYIRKPNLIKTISYKHVDELYLDEKIKISYCFLGTMFHNVSGELYSGFYTEKIEAVIKNSGKKVYARGGVNEKSVELAYKLGFHGVAIYGYLWKSTAPFTKYIELVRFCKEKNIPLD